MVLGQGCNLHGFTWACQQAAAADAVSNPSPAAASPVVPLPLLLASPAASWKKLAAFLAWGSFTSGSTTSMAERQEAGAGAGQVASIHVSGDAAGGRCVCRGAMKVAECGQVLVNRNTTLALHLKQM